MLYECVKRMGGPVGVPQRKNRIMIALSVVLFFVHSPVTAARIAYQVGYNHGVVQGSVENTFLFGGAFYHNLTQLLFPFGFGLFFQRFKCLGSCVVKAIAGI